MLCMVGGIKRETISARSQGTLRNICRELVTCSLVQGGHGLSLSLLE